MERGQTPKILRLVLNSVFVSLPPSPFLNYILSLSAFYIYSLKIFKYALTAHASRAMHAQYTWGLLTQKLNCLLGFMPTTYASLLRMCLFSPLYASI